MAGLIGSLHSAKSGMAVSQTSIQTTSHNINNMNTPGYSRQRVQQSAKSAYSNPGYNSSLGAGQIGTGVEATDVIRIRNTFYDYQYRSESHNYGEISVKYEHYTSMETIFNEPSETSISASIGNFFASWQELSKNPTDVGSKDIVVQNAKYLADNISTIKGKLDNLIDQADKKLNEDIEEINKMLNQLKDLDKQIKIIEGSGKTPNDLMDQRDNILDELSFKMDLNKDEVKKILNDGKLNRNELEITQDEVDDINNKMDYLKYLDNQIDNHNKLISDTSNRINELKDYISKNPDNEDAKKELKEETERNGNLILQRNNLYKVKEEKTEELGGTLNELTDRLVLDKDNVIDSVKDGNLQIDEIKIPNKSGEIQGSLDIIKKIQEYSDSLSDLAKGIATSVNKVLMDGGSSTPEVFIFNDGGEPIISVNEELYNNPRSLDITTKTALAMYNLKDEKISIGKETTTIDKFYNQIIQKLGNESQEVIRAESNQSKILKEIDSTRLSVSGVSLDEEMVNLVQFQHAYNASAKVVSTIDSLLDVVINGLKR